MPCTGVFFTQSSKLCLVYLCARARRPWTDSHSDTHAPACTRSGLRSAADRGPPRSAGPAASGRRSSRTARTAERAAPAAGAPALLADGEKLASHSNQANFGCQMQPIPYFGTHPRSQPAQARSPPKQPRASISIVEPQANVSLVAAALSRGGPALARKLRRPLETTSWTGYQWRIQSLPSHQRQGAV